MRRRPHRVDPNQPAIVAALRRAGCSVAVTSQLGNGFPDLVVGRLGRNYLLELKGPGGKLTAQEREFSAAWDGQYDVARSTLEALRIVGARL